MKLNYKLQRNILLFVLIMMIITALLDTLINKDCSMGRYILLNFIEIGLFVAGWTCSIIYKNLFGGK